MANLSANLSAITRGRIEQSPRILLYGPPKIGKSTFAAQIPGALFIASEQGTQNFATYFDPQHRKRSRRNLPRYSRNEFAYNGGTKTKAQVQAAFDRALDRRMMRKIIEAIKGVK